MTTAIQQCRTATFRLLSMTAVATIIAGCNAADEGKTVTYAVPAAPVQKTITLAGSGGDMSKYLGTWVSGCGSDILRKDSAIVTFNFTQVLNGIAFGEASTVTYRSVDCSGTPQFGGIPSTQPVLFMYKNNVTVATDEKSNPNYIGSGDLVYTDPLSTDDKSDIYIGFGEKFGQFQTANSSKFSQFNLVYTKR